MQVWANKKTGDLIIRVGDVNCQGSIEDFENGKTLELFYDNRRANSRFIMSNTDLVRDYEIVYNINMITKQAITKNLHESSKEIK